MFVFGRISGPCFGHAYRRGLSPQARFEPSLKTRFRFMYTHHTFLKAGISYNSSDIETGLHGVFCKKKNCMSFLHDHSSHMVVPGQFQRWFQLELNCLIGILSRIQSICRTVFLTFFVNEQREWRRISKVNEQREHSVVQHKKIRNNCNTCPNTCPKSLKSSSCAKEIEEQENVERYKAIGEWKMTNNRRAKSLKTSKCAKEIEVQENV